MRDSQPYQEDSVVDNQPSTFDKGNKDSADEAPVSAQQPATSQGWRASAAVLGAEAFRKRTLDSEERRGAETSFGNHRRHRC